MKMRRVALPLVAGLLSATTAFGIVAIAQGGGDAGSRSTQATTGATPTPTTMSAAAAEGRVAYAAMGCGSCHMLTAAGSSGTIGPNLDLALASHTRASLRAAILSPPPSYMPKDFGTRLSDVELDALVSFLLTVRER